MNDTVTMMTTIREDSHLPRKVFHILAASIIPTVYYLEIAPRQWTVYMTIVVAILWIATDMVRVRSEKFNIEFTRLAGWLLKTKEKKSLTGSSYVLMGTTLSLILYTPPIAAASVYFSAIGDPAAALVGKNYGVARFSNGKSLGGTAAMLAVCAGIGVAISGFGAVALAGAAVAAIVELSSCRVDDNLSVPLASGAAMTLISWVTV